MRSIEVGDWKYYYENGNKEHVAHYDKEGRKIGVWKYYNEKGKLLKQEEYENDNLINTKEYIHLDSQKE